MSPTKDDLKFQPGTVRLEKARQAWLRFLKETGPIQDADEATQAAFKLAVTSDSPGILEALELTREAAFTPAEMDAYDKYWDMVSRERTLMGEKFLEGKTEGKAEARARMIEELTQRWLAAGKTDAGIQQLLGH